jgi:transposase
VFKQCDRDTVYLFPPSVQDWLPEEHLARFVVEIVEQCNLEKLRSSYAGRGSEAYSPEMLVALLFYGYATGVFSSRQLERSTYDSVAFRYVAANSHPDHDTIATFRKRFLREIKGLFEQILMIAAGAGLLKVGTVSIDGTKVKANASKHKALSYGHACKVEQQLKEEVVELLKRAEAADKADIPDGLSIPEELARRDKRLKAIAEAKSEIERRAAERYAQQKEAYEKRVAQREAKEKQSGKKPRGKEPKPPVAGPTDKDQVNLTDGESRIMPKSGGGFEQAYNAQAGVDTGSMMIIASHVSQQANDKQQLTPVLEAIELLPEEVGKVSKIIADSGYYSEKNIKDCEDKKMEPYIAIDRQSHNQGIWERFSEPGPLPEDADAVTRMKRRLKTMAGKAVYAVRKSTVEPVFGVIKAAMGFDRFLLRGLAAVSGEWDLVCIAWNIKRLHVLRG